MIIEMNKTIMALQDLASLYIDADSRNKRIVSDLRGHALDQAIKVAEEEYKQKRDIVIFSLTNAVETLQAEVNKISDFHSEDASISATSTMLKNEGIPRDAIKKIAINYRGNQTALSLLKAASRPEYKDIFDAFIFDVDECFETIKSNIRSIGMSDNYNTLLSVVSNIRVELERLASMEGIEAGMGSDIEEMRLSLIASMMGLDPTDIK